MKKLETYIPFKPCKRGHFERYVNGGGCIECKRLHDKSLSREIVSTSRKLYYQKNKEQLKTKYQKNKEQLKTKRENNTVLEMIKRAKGRAKKKGLEFNLVESDIVIPKYCPVFPEIELTRNGEKNYSRSTCCSLDRIDNNKGYVKGNIKVISNRANRLKGDATCGELKRLYEYTKSLQEKN